MCRKCFKYFSFLYEHFKFWWSLDSFFWGTEWYTLRTVHTVRLRFIPWAVWDLVLLLQSYHVYTYTESRTAHVLRKKSRSQSCRVNKSLWRVDVLPGYCADTSLGSASFVGKLCVSPNLAVHKILVIYGLCQEGNAYHEKRAECDLYRRRFCF